MIDTKIIVERTSRIRLRNNCTAMRAFACLLEHFRNGYFVTFRL